MSVTARYTHHRGQKAPDFCVYCGAAATVYDHVVPQRVFRAAARVGMPVVLPRSLAEDPARPATVPLRAWAVPSCRRCNGAAGAVLDPSLAARLTRVRARVVT